MLYDLQETVSEVPKEYFRTDLLPPLREDIHLHDVVGRMKRRGHITGDRWTLWPQDPCETVDDTKTTKSKIVHEDIIFKPFETLADQVLRAALNLPDNQDTSPLPATCLFLCNPSGVPQSIVRSYNSRPDAYAIRAGATAQGGRIQWADIATPGEFKTKSPGPDTNDNNTKVLWSMHHIMREDLCRRFVYGFTIENRTMRWWFCSRSDVFVSQPLDFISEHDLVCDFLLRIMLATPVQLGWDPTITISSQKPLQYDITVHDIMSGELVPRKYRTKTMIWDMGAKALRGRGTRVWSVVEVVNGQETTRAAVLKVSWKDKARDAEGKIFNDIRRSIVDTGDEESLEVFDDLFMDVEAYGDVVIDGRCDCTDEFLPEQGPPPADTGCIPVKVRSTDKRRVVGGARIGPRAQNKDPSKKPPIALKYSPKTQHRTVFKCIGKPLLELEWMSDVYGCIYRVFLALEVLHGHGWLHRDISYGNVLSVGTGDTKITDLEYVKKINDTTPHTGVRTGTPYFMSVEVASNTYLFAPAIRDGYTPPTAGETAGLRARLLASKKMATDKATSASHLPLPPNLPGPSRSGPRIPFRHNPLHDMESVAWLALYLLLIPDFVIGHRPDGSKYEADEWKAFMDAHHELAWNAFCSGPFRLSVLQSPGYLAKSADRLHPTVGIIVRTLDRLFSDLTEAYREVEKNLRPGQDVLPTDFSAVRKSVSDRILGIEQHLALYGDLKIVPEISTRRHRPTKPGRSQKKDKADEQSGGDHDDDGDSADEARGFADNDTDDASSDDDRVAEESPAARRANMMAFKRSQGDDIGRSDDEESPAARKSKAPKLTRGDDVSSSRNASYPRIPSFFDALEQAKDEGSAEES
ncbi:hypothetical protein PsYK624_112570 [Phanerochaete sordida]|uniref:Fungal-type protein kinase domain-containing protein n=1 Tax=Phanerochaete sordida TaxID=48140 RepID=A0A9P3GHM9_9APHY|nr:hypothetical protein PsYK624_112570 [Phanerochaete sordida]